ncbi:Coatomer subunit epsilon [Fasciola hepatica]|uniref:Coatomer subunit epsilon n=1 Tax=Fasciola hepatica TaxID=6192 RepID=A0A4E0RY59_FASHE|nr:Coatomer subunit epsilon [Fasciola hepatica]
MEQVLGWIEVISSIAIDGSILFSALSVQCLLSMHRYDLAGKAVRRMQVADEDALPCQLATAMYYLTKVGNANRRIFC